MADFSVGQSIGVGAAGSAINAAFGLAGSALDYHFSRKLAAQQNQYNVDMWKMQNEYNSPQAQMQRFQEAGLNPNLMYGQGTPGNATSAPEAVVPQNPNFGKSIAQMAKAGDPMAIMTLRSLSADVRAKEAEADAKQINAQNMIDEQEARQVFHQMYYDETTGSWLHPDTSLPVFVHKGRDDSYQYYLRKIIQDNLLRKSTLDINNARRPLIGSQYYLNEAKKDLTEKQYNMLVKNLLWFDKMQRFNLWNQGIRTGIDAVGLFKPGNWAVSTNSYFPYSY